MNKYEQIAKHGRALGLRVQAGLTDIDVARALIWRMARRLCEQAGTPTAELAVRHHGERYLGIEPAPTGHTTETSGDDGDG